MQGLVDRLKTLSAPGGGARQPIDLRSPMGHAAQFVQPTLSGKHIELVKRFPTEPCLIVGNTAELEQLFLNLLLNAHDASPDGGVITIELIRTATEIVATVADDGPGIPADLLQQIFEPFFTTKTHGSGLGLAISSSIAQSHGARLRAGTSPSGGAVFIVEFPIFDVSPVVA
jgi:signal transduction histidine kinase